MATGAEDSIFVSCIAFDTEAVNALLAPGDKESVALSGSLTPKVWTDNQGNTKPALDMIVHAVLTAYHMTRKRRAVAKDEAAASKAPQPGSRPVQPDFNDDLNF